MKIERLEDGIRFRAWVGHNSEKLDDKWGLLWDGPGKQDGIWGWTATGDTDIHMSLGECCVLGRRLLAPVEPGKRRRVEITVRFV